MTRIRNRYKKNYRLREKQPASSRMAGRANPFDWIGRDPALDFVNTLDERPSGAPVENLATYRDLARFAALAGLIEPSASHRLRSLAGPNCARIAKRARGLREHLTRSWPQPAPARPCPKPRWMQSHRRCAGLTRRACLSQRHRQTRSGTAGSRHPRRKFRCTPARSQSNVCSLRPIIAVSESAARPTARCISSIQARRIAGSGAACRTAAIGKNNGAGVRARIEKA
jgi:hypothetical protein